MNKNLSTGVNSSGLEMGAWEERALILVDLDAFFASVEQLDHPEWRGLPVVVGGSPDKHGVVSTCSYEARKFGVKSAMPSSVAHKLCPQAIWTSGNFSRYREISKQVMQIIRDETPYIQQVSIDEAFADITPTRINREHPVSVASRIQKRVHDIGITCSIGLGTSKSVAKIASDIDKPNGLTVVYPGCEKTFLQELPIRVMSGVGPVAEEKLVSAGINTLGEMSEADNLLLEKIFGKNAEMMRMRALGSDISDVNPESSTKSVSHEVTFANDLDNRDDLGSTMAGLLAKVGRRLRKKGIKGRNLSIKVRFNDRTIHTAQLMLAKATDDDIALFPYAMTLLDKVWRPGIKVRLIGVGLSAFDGDGLHQDSLFDLDTSHNAENNSTHKPLIPDKNKRECLLKATDTLKDKFGESALMFGSELKSRENNTGSSSKNPSDYK